MSKIKVFGLLKEAEFHQAQLFATALCSAKPETFADPDCCGMIEYEWLHFLETKKQQLGGQMWTYKDTTMVFVDETLIGCTEKFSEWAAENHDFRDLRPLPLFHALAKQEYKTRLQSTKHSFVYLNITVDKDGKDKGQMVIELFNDLLPITCENFKELCKGEMKESKMHDPPIKLSYQNSIIHRVVKNGWLQGGDFLGAKGNNGWSIYGETFEDENYAVRHDKRGIVGMANKGRHSNASQFYITLQETPWMDYQYVAFGQVIEGLSLLDRLEVVETFNERPVTNCTIVECGVLDVDNLFI